MPLQATSGAASYDAFGGGVPVEPNYIESVFSTFLYTGNGSTQTITNGIDLAGEGGLVWTKSRSNATSNIVFDTAMGGSSILVTNSTSAKITTSAPPYLTFNSNGFSFNKSAGGINQSPDTYASWTFRKQPKFFDVVTYTGNGVARTIAHDLGSVPGCIIVKRTDATRNWCVYHRSLGNTNQIILNSTAALESTALWNNTTPTSTVFSVNNDLDVNASGGTYVAYLFAHDAGGFGLTGTDNVISCGSFTTDGSGNATVDLGYEPQWLVNKATNNPQNWIITDNMRGMFASSQPQCLFANTSGEEITATNLRITSTGFTITGYAASQTSIYIAIRRGPMKVPTTGTEVFTPVAVNNTNPVTYTSGFVTDTVIHKHRQLAFSSFLTSRIAGGRRSGLTDPGGNNNVVIAQWDRMTGAVLEPPGDAATTPNIAYMFKRSPGFYDVSYYLGNGTTQIVKHNLNVIPELIISSTTFSDGGLDLARYVYSAFLGQGINLRLNTTNASQTNTAIWQNTAPTASQFYVGDDANISGFPFYAHLFASCPGVSKVGSYTGTGTTLQINCGFTAGARFVLIKRTNSTGGWYVWDSARGIVAGNDPYLLLNSTAAEVTSTDYVDTYSAGFEISSTAPSAINASGGTFIFLAIA
jgi:hypothetical protein